MMDVVIKIKQVGDVMDAEVSLVGLPDCCEAHELKAYLDQSLPPLINVMQNIGVIHRKANIE